MIGDWSALTMKFSKRTYSSISEFLADLRFAIRNIKHLRELKNKGLISPAFRERLMLVVTAVNGCRYCSYIHARQALRSGVAQKEIIQLLSGDVDSCLEEEALALIYAQHWAESNAYPDEKAVLRLQETYDIQKSEAIHLVLRIIRLGNLVWNSLDYILYRLSFGKWQR